MKGTIAFEIEITMDIFLPSLEIFKREERWYSEDDRDVLQKMYEGVAAERKWLLGFVEGEDGSIKEESYHYNSLNYEYKTSFKY